MRVRGVIHIFYIILYSIVDIVIVNLSFSYEGNFVYVSILLYKHISNIKKKGKSTRGSPISRPFYTRVSIRLAKTCGQTDHYSHFLDSTS